MKKLFLFMLLTLSLYACSQPETNEPEPETTPVDSVANMPESMPDDFDFSIQFGVGKNNEINTFEGTVTKDLIENGTATAEISLTEEGMNQIYEKMKEINIEKSKEFTPEPVDGTICSVEPHEEDAWEISVNGETITHSISGAYCDPTEDTKEFIELRE